MRSHRLIDRAHRPCKPPDGGGILAFLARRRPSSVHADRVRVGTGLPAQARSLAGERFIVPPLGRALEDPGHLGEQISPAPGKRAELSNRGGFLAAGQVAPSSPVPRLARQLGDEDTISFRALIHQDPDAPIETELVGRVGAPGLGPSRAAYLRGVGSRHRGARRT